MSIRVGLNLVHAMPDTASGWNYMANLISGLNNSDDDTEYIAFVTDVSKNLLPQKSRIKPVYANVRPIYRGKRVLYENTILQYLAHHYSLDCMHWFAHTCSLVNIVPSVVTIHDLLVFRNPKAFSLIKRLYLVTMMKHAAKYASILLPVSNFTASDLSQFLHIQPDRMIVIPIIIPAEFTRVDELVVESFKSKYRLPDKFWLYVAHTFEHKNHKKLLEAYCHAKAKGLEFWPLVLRGEASDAEAELNLMIKELRLSQQVVRLPGLDYSELPVLYSAASALIFPSLFEGRGIPILEAMACGCPVACSDIPPLRDSADSAALYFDPNDVNSICNAIYKFQTDDLLRDRLSRTGIERLRDYQQQRIVNKLHQAYRIACGR